MTEGLGYTRFGAHGGAWGAGVTACLGLAYPEQVMGIHVTALESPYLDSEARELSQAEQAFLKETEAWEKAEGGYSHLQRTKPQTLSYGLNDSPVGLAAWIVEKFRSWSDCDGDMERRFTKDELLANVTLYWVTQTINSSMRPLLRSAARPRPLQAAGAHHSPLRHRSLSERHRPAAARMGRTLLQRAALDTDAARRSLPRNGRAGIAGSGHTLFLQATALRKDIASRKDAGARKT